MNIVLDQVHAAKPAESALKRQFIDGQFGQMHLRVGRPLVEKYAPLICLHMFPQSSKSLARFVTEMSDDRVVVAPDFPGYGESDAPSAPITAQQYAASIWDCVDALALDQTRGHIDVFGIHAGAKLAAEMAHQRPAAVNRIALSSAAILNASEVNSIRSSLARVPLDLKGTRFQSLWHMLVRNQGPDVSLEMMAMTLAEILRGGEQYDWGSRAVFDYNSTFAETLGALPHPVLLMNPGDDLYAMTPRSLPYLQRGTLYDRHDWGQGFMETRAHEVATAVRQFLQPH